MDQTILVKEKGQAAMTLDPRTKLALLITIATFVLGGSGLAGTRDFAPFLSAIVLVLLMTIGAWKASLIYLILYITSYILQLFILPNLTGVLGFILLALTGFILRLVPGFMMGYYTVRSTSVSEFISAMEKLGLPESVVIPMSVMFRFFPTIYQEYRAINDAMKMRGVRLGGGKAWAILEYRIVPLLFSTVKIGEELSAAALTRGLGGPVKRTNICKIGFNIQDYILIGLCILVFIHHIYGFFVGA